MAENVTSQKIGVTSSNFQPRRNLSCRISLNSRRREDSENIGVVGSISIDTRVTALDVQRCDVIKFSTSPKPIVSYIVGFASKRGFRKYRG